MNATLLPLLERDAVSIETLRQRYGSLLGLVRSLIGVVPNCSSYLEIWPVGFRPLGFLLLISLRPEDANLSDSVRMLRARPPRPRRHPAKCRDELAPSHSDPPREVQVG
jgi:hypothetical protein